MALTCWPDPPGGSRDASATGPTRGCLRGRSSCTGPVRGRRGRGPDGDPCTVERNEGPAPGGRGSAPTSLMYLAAAPPLTADPGRAGRDCPKLDLQDPTPLRVRHSHDCTECARRHRLIAVPAKPVRRPGDLPARQTTATCAGEGRLRWPRSWRMCRYERRPPPGGWFVRTEHWSVGRHPTMQMPGWVAGRLRRQRAGRGHGSGDRGRPPGTRLPGLSRPLAAPSTAFPVPRAVLTEPVGWDELQGRQRPLFLGVTGVPRSCV